VDARLKAVIEAGDLEHVERLLAEDPALAKESEGALSAVMLAAYYKQPRIADALLAVRGPADLFEAAALGRDERVGALIGWDPRAVMSRASDGFTALHLAAYFARPGVVRRLVDAGADVEDVAANASEVRPLHSAVAGGSLEVVETLLAAGAEAETRQHGGFTPLMGAAAGGWTDMVTRLLDAGADKCARTDDGQTALDLALQHHHAHLKTLLEG
jgi:ankyrin repeat protein